MLEADLIPEIEEIYTRQFICYEIPNTLETGYPPGKMKPFILFLQVSKLLKDNNKKGLNKLETGLFLQKFRDHKDDLSKTIYKEILTFRKELSKRDSSKKEKKLVKKYKKELREKAAINPNTPVKDYSDTTFRYFTLSGLFTHIGKRLVVRPNKEKFVEGILDKEPIFNFDNNPFKYFEYFYKNSYPIPSDKKDFAVREIEALKKAIRDKKRPLLKEANKISVSSDLSEIRNVRFRLIEYNNWEREQDYANVQREKDQVENIIKYLRKLNGESIKNSPEIDDRPAFLEWAVWRSFLAINKIKSPIHETRRFPIDQDFLPRNTAPGGGADLIFEFDSYVLAVEVTLTTSNRQMAVESEPVRRHTVGYKDEYPNKDVYCLFVAPKVDNNVVETFRIGVWYKKDYEEFVNIIPFNLSDFISTIEVLVDERYSNSDFRSLLDRCLVFRNFRAPQWKSSISDEIMVWKRKMLSE